MALTKADFAEQLTDAIGLDKREANALVDGFFETAKTSLAQGEPVKVSGFGKFELRDKLARLGRNSKTGEETIITPRRVVTFKPGQKLKARLDKSTGNQ
jgi:integration host factor subunit alpha